MDKRNNLNAYRTPRATPASTAASRARTAGTPVSQATPSSSRQSASVTNKVPGASSSTSQSSAMAAHRIAGSARQPAYPAQAPGTYAQVHPPYSMYPASHYPLAAPPYSNGPAVSALPMSPLVVDDLATRILHQIAPTLASIGKQQIALLDHAGSSNDLLKGMSLGLTEAGTKIEALTKTLQEYEEREKQRKERETQIHTALTIMADRLKGFRSELSDVANVLGKSEALGDQEQTISGRMRAMEVEFYDFLEKFKDPEANLTPGSVTSDPTPHICTHTVPTIVRHEMGTSPIRPAFAGVAVLDIPPSPTLPPVQVPHKSYASARVGTSPIPEVEGSASASPDASGSSNTSADTLVGEHSAEATLIKGSGKGFIRSPLQSMPEVQDIDMGMEDDPFLVSTSSQTLPTEEQPGYHPPSAARHGNTQCSPSPLSRTPSAQRTHNLSTNCQSLRRSTSRGSKKTVGSLSPVDWTKSLANSSVHAPRPGSPLKNALSPVAGTSISPRMNRSYTLPQPAEGTVAALRQQATGDPFAFHHFSQEKSSPIKIFGTQGRGVEASIRMLSPVSQAPDDNADDQILSTPTKATADLDPMDVEQYMPEPESQSQPTQSSAISEDEEAVRTLIISDIPPSSPSTRPLSPLLDNAPAVDLMRTPQQGPQALSRHDSSGTLDCGNVAPSSVAQLRQWVTGKKTSKSHAVDDKEIASPGPIVPESTAHIDYDIDNVETSEPEQDAPEMASQDLQTPLFSQRDSVFSRLPSVASPSPSVLSKKSSFVNALSSINAKNIRSRRSPSVICISSDSDEEPNPKPSKAKEPRPTVKAEPAAAIVPQQDLSHGFSSGPSVEVHENEIFEGSLSEVTDSSDDDAFDAQQVADRLSDSDADIVTVKKASRKSASASRATTSSSTPAPSIAVSGAASNKSSAVANAPRKSLLNIKKAGKSGAVTMIRKRKPRPTAYDSDDESEGPPLKKARNRRENSKTAPQPRTPLKRTAKARMSATDNINRSPTKRPRKATIDWPSVSHPSFSSLVECTSCNEWYHIGCVGLSSKEFEALHTRDDEYQCPPCKQGVPRDALSPRKAAPSAKSSSGCSRPSCLRLKAPHNTKTVEQQSQADDEFAVDGFVGMMKKVIGGTGGELKYLVKWTNYPYKDCTWQTVESLHLESPEIYIDTFEEDAAKEGLSTDIVNQFVILKGARDAGWVDFYTPVAVKHEA